MTDTHFTTYNPHNLEPLATYHTHNKQQVEQILNCAATGYQKWKNYSFAWRALVMHQIADAFAGERENLALIATAEMGKPVQQSREEIDKCVNAMRYYAQNAEAMLAPVIVPTDAQKSYVYHAPIGTVLAIMPWNFPYWQVIRCFAPAAMAGNTVLLKHAANVTGCALAMERIINAVAGMEGLFQVLLIPHDAVEDVIANRVVAAVSLTGSTNAGKIVASLAGKYLKKAVLELGGSDPYIIANDADPQQAAQICVTGRMKNTGQSCIAVKRCIALPEVKVQFETEAAKLINAIKWGNPLEADCGIGPLARPDLCANLHRQVTESVAMGAKLICGGYLPDTKGCYYPPTLLTDVTPAMPAFREELFGPVLAIVPATDLQHAIAMANDSDYGLGAGIITKDIANAMRMAENEIEAGACFINQCVHSDVRLPFGGIKNSGYGRELADNGIKEFVNIKTISVR